MPALGPVSFEEWDIFQGRDSLDTEGMYDIAPALLRQEGQRVWGCVYDASRALGEGERALLVSHSPLIECAAAYGAEHFLHQGRGLSDWPPVFKVEKGDILTFQFYRGTLAKILHLPCP